MSKLDVDIKCIKSISSNITQPEIYCTNVNVERHTAIHHRWVVKGRYENDALPV